MNNVTKEWLQKTIAELEEERDAVPGVVNEDAAMALAAMKLALASLEAEPVAWMVKGTDTGEKIIRSDMSCFEGSCQPLYAAPPAPVSVPDEDQCKPHPVMAVKGELGFLDHFDRIISERDEDIDIGQLGSSNYEALMLAALDAFRAAMLQGAEPVTTAYKLRDTWVACSDRMPEEGQEVIIMDAERGEVISGMIYQRGSFVDCIEEYFEVKNPPYWMPLPAAPQQEVKP